MKKSFLIILLALCSASVVAQPAKRRVQSNAVATQQQPQQQQGEGQAKPTPASDRAAMLFPTSDAMPEDVVWRRDIYRQLDLLSVDKNAALYYPVEPIGQQCNLFTYLFRLFLTGRVSAYNFTLDGNESFAEKNKITDVKELLERYYIYYEDNNGKPKVADNDVPSAFVKRYYIKESVYLDQRTGTMSTKVTALCPILIEGDDMGEGAAPKPLFWMKYDDLAPYLAKLPIMSSNYNNVTNMTADDFFTRNLYEGKIYKTANMQGRVLGDYCKTDSAMKTEQEKIEKQLADFEAHLFAHCEKVDSTATDSVEAAKPAKGSRRTAATATRSNQTKVEEKSSASSRRSNAANNKKSSGSTAPVASVRRTRR